MFNKLYSKFLSNFSKDTNITIIPKGTTFTGELQTEGDVFVEGVITTEVLKCKKLTVAPGGKVDGCVEAESTEIMGVINGNVISATIKVYSTGQLTGDLMYYYLFCDNGIINGALRGNTDLCHQTTLTSIRK